MVLDRRRRPPRRSGRTARTGLRGRYGYVSSAFSSPKTVEGLGQRPGHPSSASPWYGSAVPILERVSPLVVIETLIFLSTFVEDSPTPKGGEREPEARAEPGV